MHSFALKAGSAAYVLAEKEMSSTGPCFVHLKGRKAGLWNFILTLLGISSYVTLDVYGDRLEHSEASLSGMMTETVPLSKVSNFGYGYLKPIVLLVMGIVFSLISLGLFLGAIEEEDLLPFAFIPLIVAVIFLIAYCLMKNMCLYWNSDGASGNAIILKRSVIEGVSLTEEEASAICNFILQLVRQENSR